jgi:uncharacterized protein
VGIIDGFKGLAGGVDVDASATLSGLFVGLLVGFTGVGGGSVMAPLMILILGVAPVTAVATDLWFASLTKAVGAIIHRQRGNTNLKVGKWLCLGSIPCSLLTILVLSRMQVRHTNQSFVSEALGTVLVLTAGATFCRPAIHRLGERIRVNQTIPLKAFQVPLTVGAGALLGVLVTLTSVGAGALCATILVFLYPLRLNLRQIVGTDIVHAVPLTLVAGLGHLWLGNVDTKLLLSLLTGSIPGIIAGSLLIHKLNDRAIQVSLAGVLLLVGTRLVFV